MNDFSSKLDYPLEVVETIDATHTGMARFASTRSPGYQDVFQALQGYVGNLASLSEGQQTSLSPLYDSQQLL